MKRGISIAMVILGIWTMITGIWQVFPPYNEGVDPAHIIPSFSFAILLFIHAWLNKKPIIKYFKGLGWKWLLVGLGIFAILWAGIGLPIITRMGD